MIININHKTTIKELQTKFSEAYPFLKIEFADRPHKIGAAITKRAHWYDSSFKLLAIALKPESGWILIHPWHRTGGVEDTFRSRFGLYPQIFRKEGERWIQTAGTDVFTLEEQNGIGKRIVDKSHDPYWREREVLL